VDPTADKGVRKFRIALVAMGLVLVGFVLCAIWPALEDSYTAYTMAVLGAAGIFSGSNVLEKRAIPPVKP
jgi:hypothetical protein